MRNVNPLKIVMLVCTLLGGVAIASAIKSWSTSETIQAYDLNSNFSHVHSQAERSWTNSNISASAAISHSKLASPGLVPKIWGLVSKTGSYGAACDASPCTVDIQQPTSTVTSVTRTSTGLYVINWASLRTDAIYGLFLTPMVGAMACKHVITSSTTALATVQCVNDLGSAADGAFQFMLMDNT